MRRELPTVAFKASTQRQNKNIGRSHAASGSTAYGADELTAVLGGYSRRKGIKTGVTCAVVGFPNVGKSSVINSLARSKVCSVGPTAGHTKTTQEVAIDKEPIVNDHYYHLELSQWNYSYIPIVFLLYDRLKGCEIARFSRCFIWWFSRKASYAWCTECLRIGRPY